MAHKTKHKYPGHMERHSLVESRMKKHHSPKYNLSIRKKTRRSRGGR
jgi:hypothetical protein